MNVANHSTSWKLCCIVKSNCYPYNYIQDELLRGVGTATACAALAAPLFSLKKKKNGKKSGEKKNQFIL